MRFFSPLAAIAAVGLSVSAPAYAHPKLVSSTPAANASVSAPSRITLTFTEGLMSKLSGAETLAFAAGVEDTSLGWA
jgi:copper resistance protein C